MQSISNWGSGLCTAVPRKKGLTCHSKRKGEHIWEKEGWSTAGAAAFPGDLISVLLTYRTCRHRLCIHSDLQKTRFPWQCESSFPRLACAGDTEPGHTAALGSQGSTGICVPDVPAQDCTTPESPGVPCLGQDTLQEGLGAQELPFVHKSFHFYTREKWKKLFI